MIMDSDMHDPFSDDRASLAETVLPDYVTEVNVPRNPPRYTPRNVPDRPCIYTFASWNSNTMYLLPPRELDRQRTAIFSISVELNLNPFVPLSYVTTVRRGPDENGDVVGEFELGVKHHRAIVQIGNHATRMSNVLHVQDRSQRLFKWKFDDADLRWDCRTTLDDGSPMCICSNASSIQLASFVPPPLDASPPPPPATLTIFPDGNQFFEHILLSALVIERKMTLSF